MTYFRIVNGDNFDGGYTDEKFVENLPAINDRAYAQAIADAINNSGDRVTPRFFRVVKEGYVLRPGCEP